jgi:sulfur-oxidizing protein SoxZ
VTEPIRIRAVVRGEVTEVRALIPHPMETGARKDAAGRLVPAHYITQVTALHAGRVVLSAQWGTAVSKDPFIQFSFAGGRKGDEITITWTDSRGETRTDKAVIN